MSRVDRVCIKCDAEIGANNCDVFVRCWVRRSGCEGSGVALALAWCREGSARGRPAQAPHKQPRVSPSVVYGRATHHTVVALCTYERVQWVFS